MAPTQSQELINVKLLLIGNSSVGKSSLLLRFSDKQWLPEDEASATIGVDFRVRSHSSPLSLYYIDDVPDVGCGLRCGCLGCCGITISGTQVGRSGTEGQDEHMGAFIGFSSPPLLPWGILPLSATASRLGKGKMLIFFCVLLGTVRYSGHRRPRTVSHYHSIILPWCPGRHTRYDSFPALRFSLS